MNEEQRKLADVLDYACRRLDEAETFGLEDANAIAATCLFVRLATEQGRDPEELLLSRLAYFTEELLVSLMMVDRDDLEPAVKGDVWVDLVAWRQALEELAELRGTA